MVPFLLAAGALTSVATNIVQTKMGYDQYRQANEAIKNFKFSPLDYSNAYKNLTTPGVGVDVMTSGAAEQRASTLETLKQGGARTFLAGAPQVDYQYQQSLAEAAKYYDEQQKQIDQLIAQEQSRLGAEKRQRTYQGDVMALQALGQEKQAGLETFTGGLGGIAKDITAAGQIDFTNFWGKQ